jgi:hypothetical protein
MTLFQKGIHHYIQNDDHWIVDIEYPWGIERKIIKITIHDFWEDDDSYLCQVDYIGSDIWSYVRKDSPDKIDGKYNFKLIRKINLYE